MEDQLAQFFARDAIANGPSEVNFDFGGPVQGDAHRQRGQAALFQGQARAGPDLAPSEFGGQFLKRHVQVIGVGK